MLLAGAAASYAVARETSLFAIQRVEVVGGSAQVRHDARAALATLEGQSLVGLRASDVERPLAAVPDVAGSTYDRAFPHTLRVVVMAERPLLVLRRGGESWLVSVRGRVLRRLTPGLRADLPRLWIRRSADVRIGEALNDRGAARGVRVLAAAVAELGDRVATARFADGDAVVELRGGVEVRLGSDHELRLKVTVAAAILPHLEQHEEYLDVSVPVRPVAGGDRQPRVEVDG